MEENQYRVELQKKPDEQLIQILYFEKSNYSYEAIQQIKIIIRDRKISDDLIKKTKKTIKRKRRKEYLEKQKENSNYMIGEFIFEFLLFILP